MYISLSLAVAYADYETLIATHAKIKDDKLRVAIGSQIISLKAKIERLEDGAQ